MFGLHGRMDRCFMLVIVNSAKCGVILLVFKPLLSNTLASALVLVHFN